MKGKSRKKGKLAERGVSLSGSVCSPDSCLIRPNCPAAKILLSAAALFALCVILTTVNLLSSQAEEQKSSPYHKYYTSIQIQDGDSLWSIAETYRTHSGKSAAEYVCDLKEMNSLSEDTIHAGHYLTIYYYDSVPK